MTDKTSLFYAVTAIVFVLVLIFVIQKNRASKRQLEETRRKNIELIRDAKARAQHQPTED